MELMLLRLFQTQVALQCSGVLRAGAALNAFLQGPPQPNQDAFWLAMQNLLTCAANVSKACWGAEKRYVKEREPLRRSLKINSKSPFYNVWLRNRFEHFDEALDRWWNESENHNHLDHM